MEMEEKLMTKHDLAAFFQTSAASARKFCHRHGIEPINIGNGRTTRLRWLKSDVIQMLGTLEAKAEPATVIPRRKGSKTVLGKSVDDLMRELCAPVQ